MHTSHVSRPFCASIPTVSHTALMRGEASGIVNAFIKTQGVLITNAIDAEEVAIMMRRAAEIFRLPANILTHFRRHGNAPGYTPPSVEGVSRYGPDANRHFWDVVRGVARFPEPEMNASASQLATRCTEIGNALLEGVDRERGTSLARVAIRANHMLRISESLNATANDAVLFPDHGDWGLCTLFIGGAARGLEVQPQGTVEWRDATVPSGAVLAIPGSAMTLYLSDVRSLTHRVIAASTERISIFVFIDPRDDVVLPNGETAGARNARILATARRS